jgi:archaeal flagellar protein FlaJ
MFDDLKKNLEHEKKIVTDMRSIQMSMMNDKTHQDFYVSSLRALMEQLVILNNAVPELLKEGSLIKKSDGLPVSGEKPAVDKMSYVSPSTKEKGHIAINKKDRKKFLEKLKMSEDALKNIKNIKKKQSGAVVHKPNFYVRLSNKIFRKFSEKLSPQFDSLSKDLKKANIRFLLSSYLSMSMMSMVIAFFVGFLIFGLLMIFSLSNWVYFVLPFGFSGLALAGFYLYPATEAGSVQKNIAQELPFVTIHMAAIAGSNIEPTKIFKIIAMAKEYPSVAAEIKKVLTQIEIYGYDLVTSLKNVASRTSNKKLAELFSGLATNISSGGELKNYLEKKSENFLVDYKLERQKYSGLAGTFMDVYISILIAAPLVLMMMFIVMNVAGLGMGSLSITNLLALSIAGIIIVNIIFLVVLNLKQPKI